MAAEGKGEESSLVLWELVKRNEKDGSESNSKIPAEASSERSGYMDLMCIFDKVT